MSMQKKGDVNWFVITLIIGVVALVIIIVMLQQQTSKGVKSYEEFREETSVESLKKCENIVLGRSCHYSCPEGMTKVSGYECPDRQVCCERS